jgi:hypothetical protein
METSMRLRTHDDHESDSPREPGRLIFPRHALDAARRQAPRMTAGGRPLRSGDVIASIEAELDHMQDRLALLSEDVENFKFPEASDEPPVRAA